jgi:hypothetical protein
VQPALSVDFINGSNNALMNFQAMQGQVAC